PEAGGGGLRHHLRADLLPRRHALGRDREHDLRLRGGRAVAHRLAALHGADQDRDLHRRLPDDPAEHRLPDPRHRHPARSAHLMGYEWIAITMFMGMMVLLLTGHRVFAGIGFVAVVAAIALWGDRGGYDIAFTSAIKLMNWYPMLTLPMFVWMGYVMSETRLADDLYRMFHVWFGPIPGGLAIGTILLMVLVSAMNGLSVAGLAIGATIALPELLKRGYDKRMVTGIIQGGSSLGILVPPSVVLVLYSMIARQPVGHLWLAGVVPGLMMAGIFILYVVIRCRINPALGPVLPVAERTVTRAEKLRL